MLPESRLESLGGTMAVDDFAKRVALLTGGVGLRAAGVALVQVNVGYVCNLECRHCHLGASPLRRESMSWATMGAVLDLVRAVGAGRVELTGGAPEMNPHFRDLVTALRAQGVEVVVRTNLAVLMEPAQAGTAEFLRDHAVGLAASLPCYLESNVDAQRGGGVYVAAIAALRMLNGLGYGRLPELPLNLIYNPGGPHLPPEQARLEADYHRELADRHGVVFHRLLTIANVPIGRYRALLRQAGQEAAYWTMLWAAFNPATLDGLMCRTQISVGWDGQIYDCDFNLALGLPVAVTTRTPEQLAYRPIVVGNHCLACTAGSGSSCQGALVA